MGLYDRLGRSSVPVLCYHSLGGDGVPRPMFEAQMRWLKQRDAHTLTLTELAEFMRSGHAPAGHKGPMVCLTFDDGFRDLYTYAAPLMGELGFNGVVFVINNRLRDNELSDEHPGKQPGSQVTTGRETEINSESAHRDFLLTNDRSAWLSRDELRSLVQSGRFEVGSHSMSHAMRPVGRLASKARKSHWSYAPYLQDRDEGVLTPNTPPSDPEQKKADLPELAPELARPILTRDGRLETEEEWYERVRTDLARSRQELEQVVERPVTALAWPWGAHAGVTRKAALDAGYELLFTLERGAVGRGALNHAVCRLEVRRKKPLNWFRSRVFLYSRAWPARLYSWLRI